MYVLGVKENGKKNEKLNQEQCDVCVEGERNKNKRCMRRCEVIF